MERRNIRVSIVEDEKLIREMLTSLITWEEGLDLASVHSHAEHALEELPSAAPDVVIMDINLPGLSGIECVRSLSGTELKTQFLMYTVHDDDHRVFDALKAGANGYILKSTAPDRIVAAVKELNAGGSPMSAPVARRMVAHFRPAVGGGVRSDAGLSTREQEVLALLAEGLLYKEIGERLGITEGTIKQHIHRIYGKLHVQNRTEAVNRFYGR